LIVIDGQGEIAFGKGALTVSKGQSFLLPAALGEVNLTGRRQFEVFCAFVPV